MRRSGKRRRFVAIATAGLAGLAVLWFAGGDGGGAGLGGRAIAQPERGVGARPGEPVIPLPGESENPGDRSDRWVFVDPYQPPVLEAEGTIRAIDGVELLLGGPNRLEEVIDPSVSFPETGTAIALDAGTTFYVEGRPTTLDRIPIGVPARVTYQLRDDGRVALRVEVLEGEPAPPLAEPIP